MFFILLRWLLQLWKFLSFLLFLWFRLLKVNRYVMVVALMAEDEVGDFDVKQHANSILDSLFILLKIRHYHTNHYQEAAARTRINLICLLTHAYRVCVFDSRASWWYSKSCK